MNLISFYILLSLGFLPTPEHDIHISKCQIEYLESDATLEIILHIFIEDFENALELAGYGKVKVIDPKPNSKDHASLQAYISEKLVLSINGENCELILNRTLRSDDGQAAWCSLIAKGIENPKEMEIGNEILMELFNDQMNIVNVLGPNNRQGYLMFYGNKRQEKISFYD